MKGDVSRLKPEWRIQEERGGARETSVNGGDKSEPCPALPGCWHLDKLLKYIYKYIFLSLPPTFGHLGCASPRSDGDFCQSSNIAPHRAERPHLAGARGAGVQATGLIFLLGRFLYHIGIPVIWKDQAGKTWPGKRPDSAGNRQSWGWQSCPEPRAEGPASRVS